MHDAYDFLQVAKTEAVLSEAAATSKGSDKADKAGSAVALQRQATKMLATSALAKSMRGPPVEAESAASASAADASAAADTISHRNKAGLAKKPRGAPRGLFNSRANYSLSKTNLSTLSITHAAEKSVSSVAREAVLMPVC